MTEGWLFLAIGLYAAAVLAIGVRATRSAGRSPEEYFLAGRGLRPVVLFMALFGTNATTFVLVGIPARAYSSGVGVFGLNVPIIALGIPLTFWAIGEPARRMARRLGALTPAELYALRLDSRAVGITLFLAFTAWTLPYMQQAVQSVGLVLYQASDGALPEAFGAGGVLVLALIYTSLGGMRATAWTNVLQGSLFLGFVVCIFVFVPRSLGGLAAATGAVRELEPALLVVEHDGAFAPPFWTSYGLVISLTVIGFPHMFARLMAAEDGDSLRRVVRVYPVALCVLWLPVVMLGLWGAAAFPGLERPDEILFRMTRAHMPAVFGPITIVAVLAAVMSTLDAMLLTLSSMLVRDVLRPLGMRLEGREVFWGRLFTIALALCVFGAAQLRDDSIFVTSLRAFEGYVMIVPTLFLGVRWKRFTSAGAIASVVLGTGTLVYGWLTPGDSGWLASSAGFVVAVCAGVLVSLITKPPSAAVVASAFERS